MLETLSSMADGMIFQFGTSRFLQAHVDLFAEEARLDGQIVPPIAVVQSTGTEARRARVPALTAAMGYPVMIRGLEDGQLVSRQLHIHSITQGFCLPEAWDALRHSFVRNAGWVVSNTGDAGYSVAPGDFIDLAGIIPAASFPGKLTQLMHMRYAANKAPPTIMPCELVNQNGSTLKAIVSDLAHRSGAENGFLTWLDNAIFTNSLVDRIVSEALSPAGAVAEPYALWAIEDIPGLALPFTHPYIKLVSDLDVIERLKLYILNLGHSVLAEIWLTGHFPAQETVRGILADPEVRTKLEKIYHDEVLPGFAAHGLRRQAEAYIRTTLERLMNPFLNHRIADIADNHAIKVSRRITAFLNWAGTPAASLTAISARQEMEA